MANGNERRNRWSGFDLGGGSGEPRRLRTSPWVWVIGFLVVLVLFNYFAAPRPSKLDYSDFLKKVSAGQIVGTVKISASGLSEPRTANAIGISMNAENKMSTP